MTIPRRVAVATRNSEEDAEEVRRVLASSGVASFVAPLPSRFSVEVEDADADRADELLNTFYGVSEAENETLLDAPPAEAMRCPECGAAGVEEVFTIGHVVALAVIFYGAGVALEQVPLALFATGIMVFAAFIADRWRCPVCGARWRRAP